MDTNFFIHTENFKIKGRNENSGGILTYVTISIIKGVKLVKNEVCCIQWFKLDASFF